MQKSDTAWKTAARMAALAEETDDDYEREHFTRLRRPVHAPGQGIEKIVGNEIFKEIWNDSCASLKRYLAKRASIKEFRPPALRDGEIIFSGLMGRLRCEPLATPAAPPVDFCDPAPR
jgi:hypothetical protein